MKMFAATLTALLSITIIFFIASTAFPELVLLLCPAGLVAIWANGFAAHSLHVRIVIDDQPVAKASPRRREFE